MAKKAKETELFSPVIPDKSEWPLVWLSRNRNRFKREVVEAVMERMKEDMGEVSEMEEEIANAMYLEKNRIKRKPWPVDPKDEADYWSAVESRLIELTRSKTDQHDREKQLEQMMENIAARYVNEIAGNLNINSYELVRRLVPHGFASLLNKKQITPSARIKNRSLHLKKKIQFTGHIQHIRKLATKGTLVMVPTHSSNLDSILMGWGIQEIGLPPFHYGAGLNLFNIRLFGYFMNRLGAYKVDRRKKNLIYLECLKFYSALSIKDGVHSLFFPGGTRSRSGQLEDNLKLGLLSTAIEAQRMQLEEANARAKKVFIVPAVINYHFVLEAPTLIQEHLKAEGRQRFYLEKDELSNSYRLLLFLIKFLTRSSQMALTFGRPMDVFGHWVDEEGNSLDAAGNKIQIDGYFKTNGEIKRDEQREREYTKLLGEKVAREYYRSQLVFSSHLIAFVAFEKFCRQHPRLDLYELMRIPPKSISIPYEEFRNACALIREQIMDLQKKGEIDMAPHLRWSLEEIIEHGLKNLGVYHAKRTLKYDKKKKVIRTEDLKLLYFYHNRLKGYDFEKHVK
jgi:glycerol-3-phosphate O-acyltransferase